MSWTITIRSADDSLTVDVPPDPQSQADWAQDAAAWQNVMRNRGRWVGAQTALTELYRNSSEQLEAWGFDLARIRAMRSAASLEVALPGDDDPTALSIRSLPWEFLLYAAILARPQAGESPFVLRHLQLPAPPAAPVDEDGPLLYVQTAPGQLADSYDFDYERGLIEDAAGEKRFDWIKDPHVEELEAKVASASPQAIHLTGIDAVQGAMLLDGDDAMTARDGIFFKSPTGAEQWVAPDRVARAVTGGGRCRPQLVTLNTYYSSELAATIVRAGAAAAVGFHSEFDDSSAEVFFTRLYRSWASGEEPSLRDALSAAFHAILWDPIARPSLEGAPIVVWSSESLLHEYQEMAARRSSSKTLRKSKRLKPQASQVRELLEPYVEFPKYLNYCGLHNGESLFAKPARLGVRKRSSDIVPGLSVEVTLCIGGERMTYSRSVDIARANQPVDDVTLSLASHLIRALREKVQGTVTVAFSYEGQDLLRETRQVGLLATDEWQRTAPWLPSFVLPRDPAVDDVVRRAQSVLSSICDDTDAGFDGYQRLSPAERDAGENCAIVDSQVKALWWTIKTRGQLRYLGAPPTYTSQSQRIRTPSAVMRGRAGTCLDLTLLLAACVSAIDMHACIFVLKRHAFPGYFRSPEGHEEFKRLMGSKYSACADDAEHRALTRPWVMQPDGLQQLLTLVDSGQLVPIESVMLTEHGGFDRARERARTRLKQSLAQFEALYDLTLAREHGVTPLPIGGMV